VVQALLLVVAAIGACNLVAPGGPDAQPGEDADVDAAADAEATDAEAGEPDSDLATRGPGPVTLVVSAIAAIPDRLCDLDGDGDMDNVFADLGDPLTELSTSFLSSAVEGEIEVGRRVLIHFPWIDDRDGPDDPEAVCIVTGGIDLQQPPVLEDDFTGEGVFRSNRTSIDACGEPTFFFSAVAIRGGEIVASEGELPIFFGAEPLVARSASASGTLAPGGAAVTVQVCALARLADLAAASSVDGAGDLNLLEVVLAGGAPFGMPTVPGVVPDLDLDGDGLERLVLGTGSKIERCVDGDGSEIVGRECWTAPRMADAFSMNVELRGVAARFAGREEGWDRNLEAGCPGGPPESSLWDPR